VTGCDGALAHTEPEVNQQRAASALAGTVVLEAGLGCLGRLQMGCGDQKKGIKQQTWKLEKE